MEYLSHQKPEIYVLIGVQWVKRDSFDLLTKYNFSLVKALYLKKPSFSD
jgi:hypothetical protein